VTGYMLRAPLSHIPDRFEHLVRYVGWYSTRCRGERARKAVPTAAVQAPEDAQVVAARARSAWARLIHKVYEVDPLECLKCGAAGIDCPAIYH